MKEVFREQKTPNLTADEFNWFRRLREKHFSDQLWPHQNVCKKISASMIDASSSANGQTSSAAGGSSSGSSAGQPSSSAGTSGSWAVIPGSQATVVTTAAEGLWGVPHFNCAQARSWTVAFSVPFFGCPSPERPAFR
jgi:hypothetical protein